MGQSQSATAPNVTTLVSGVVYEFHKPEKVEVEIVFIHGLQIGKFEDAYWKTWCARDGHKTCWPQSWISEQYANARILSLSYNSEALQRRRENKLGPKELSENLLQQMVLPGVDIGQSDCPVIFVCHSLGGLIAKQIVVCAASEEHFQDLKIQKLLKNVQTFFFFATPHFGSNLVKSNPVQCAQQAAALGGIKSTRVVKFLQVLNKKSHSLNAAFVDYRRRYNWKLFVVSEGMQTPIQAYNLWLGNKSVVEPASAECFANLDGKINLQDSDHFTVCKPKNKQDGGFLLLLNCIKETLDDHNRRVENRKVRIPAEVFGLDRKVVEIRGHFQDGRSIVALVGMGGAGKTTLSKYYYNLESKNYERSSYLEDVATKTNQEVQKKLYGDLFPNERVNAVSNDHLDKIKQCLKNEKVLVVVDNVEESTEASCPLGAKDLGFDEGINDSRVVLTCRNQELLRRFRVGPVSVRVVEVTGIRDADGSDEALFHRHAFGEQFGDLKDTFKALTEEILKQCDGLPLTLEVIGEYLNEVLIDEERDSDRMKRWEEALQGLKGGEKFTGKDNDELWSRLQVSYNQLAPLERDMFLGFACILTEVSNRNVRGRNRVGWIWDSLSGIQHLIKRSLIQVQGEGYQRLDIHNQLRDMGRKIVENESKEDISKRTYLWKREDVLRFLQSNESSTTLKGFSLMDVYGVTTSEYDVSWAEEASTQNSCKQYSQMQLLHLHRVVEKPRVVDYCLSKCSEQNMRWLHLEHTEATFRGLQRIWLLKGLRLLQMRYLKGLEEIPEALGNLTNLVELEISSCYGLRSLPSNAMGKLIHLKSLILYFVHILTIPPEVGRLPELERLVIEGCDNLKIMCVFETDKLQKLKVGGNKLQTIKGLGNLHKLRKLELHCPSLDTCDLPGSLGKLSQLETLVFDACEGLIQKLEDAFINVSEDELPNLKVISMPFHPRVLSESPRWRNAIIIHGENPHSRNSVLFLFPTV